MASPRADLDIAQLVAEHHLAVYRYAFRLTGAAYDAEDLSQQAFLAAQEKLGQLRNGECARAWLLTMLRNLFLKSRRRRMVLPGDFNVDLAGIPAALPDDSDIDRERLQQALDELPPDYRVVVLMFYFEDCSYRQIAEQLRLPIGTVMSRLARAKAHLRRKLFAAEVSASASSGECARATRPE